ncbi:gamma-interferon-inducible lysosomal thiol reductase [Rhipicephalus sanguineus]|uniref:gamma-interferon-inducible lysosomal thiol reductase n=1 Tax=Rhipicephalus sanguineus TaxID=34632 RepID=UPI001895CB8F|nr:gamma-interferon-inducible lysosomal thiol reductase [Rhipicephalus sanguineus]
MPSSRLHLGGLLTIVLAVSPALCYLSHDNVVNITLYYEGLCSGCHFFILDQLHPTYVKLQDNLNVDILPFGNAKIKVVNGTVTFDCQHGPDECYINEVQTCAVKYVHPTRKLLDFVACMLSQDKPTEAGKPCAEKVGTDWGVLDRCSSGPEGTQLMYEMGKRTRDHMPRIEYVPWIEVNGAHNLTIQEKAQGQLFDFTCELLEPEAPKVCQKPGSYYCAA